MSHELQTFITELLPPTRGVRLPVTLIEEVDKRWLVAPYGEVSWVRSVRAAGQVTLSRRRHAETVAIVELGLEEGASVLKQYVTEVPITRPFLDITLNSRRRLSPKRLATLSSASAVYQAKSSARHTMPPRVPMTDSRFRSSIMCIGSLPKDTDAHVSLIGGGQSRMYTCPSAVISSFDPSLSSLECLVRAVCPRMAAIRLPVPARLGHRLPSWLCGGQAALFLAIRSPRGRMAVSVLEDHLA